MVEGWRGYFWDGVRVMECEEDGNLQRCGYSDDCEDWLWTG